MLNKIFFSLRCRFRYRFTHLIVFAAARLSIQCSDEGPNSIVGPLYTPPDLTNTTWEMISSPESVGWSSEKLQEAYAFSQNIQMAAVMIIYQGKVLYYWGDISRKYCVHSCCKSFMSALYGIRGNRSFRKIGFEKVPLLILMQAPAWVMAICGG